MAFLDKQKTLDAQAKAAEDELNAALEAERPEELAPKEDTEEETSSEGQVEADVTPAPKEDHDWQKRYNDLRSWVDKKLRPEYKGEIDTLKKQVDELKTQLTEFSQNNAPADLPETAEDIENLRSESPAAYNAILKIAEGIADRIVEQKTKSWKDDIAAIKEAQAQNAEQQAWIKLQKKHPNLDLEALADGQDDNFNAWTNTKSDRFLAPLFDSKEDVEAASDVLTAYEKETGVGKKRSRTTAGAADVNAPSQPDIPKGDRGYDFSESEIQRMSDKELDKNMEKIEQAQAKGRILNDLTDPVNAQRKLGAMAA